MIMENDRIYMTKASKGEHVLCKDRTLCDVRSLCKRFRNSAFFTRVAVSALVAETISTLSKHFAIKVYVNIFHS